MLGLALAHCNSQLPIHSVEGLSLFVKPSDSPGTVVGLVKRPPGSKVTVTACGTVNCWPEVTDMGGKTVPLTEVGIALKHQFDHPVGRDYSHPAWPTKDGLMRLGEFGLRGMYEVLPGHSYRVRLVFRDLLEHEPSPMRSAWIVVRLPGGF